MLIPRSVVQLARGRVLSISRLPQHLERDAKKSQPSAPRSNRTNKKGRTLATLISKSSWVTCCRRSRSAYMPRERKEITWSASLAIKAPRACVLRHRFASPRSRRRVRWKASQGPLPPPLPCNHPLCSSALSHPRPTRSRSMHDIRAALPTYDMTNIEKEKEGRRCSPASVQIPLTSAPLQLPIFSARARRLIPRCKDICRKKKTGQIK